MAKKERPRFIVFSGRKILVDIGGRMSDVGGRMLEVSSSKRSGGGPVKVWSRPLSDEPVGEVCFDKLSTGLRSLSPPKCSNFMPNHGV